MSIRSKTRTLAWFARRPSHWAHAAVHASRQVRSDKDRAECRDAATEWARRIATSEESTIRWLGYEGVDILGFDDVVGHEQLAAAQDRVGRCPVEMGGAGDLRLLFYACEAIGATRAIETGVAYGWSSFAILSSLSRRDRGFLTSVDMSYPKRGGENWVGVAVPEDLRPRWRVIERPDRYGLTRALREHQAGLDLCHYDSDKTYYGRRWAYPKLWKALRSGGIFISDDIQDNFAFREFVESRSLDYRVAESQGKYVGVCRKTSPSS